MAGIRSNIGWVQLNKQTGVNNGKGIAATFASATPGPAAGVRSRFASDDRVSPRAEFASFPETDSSRDAPDSQKMSGGTEGSFQIGARDSIAHVILEAALGARAVAVVTVNGTHTITTADLLSYWTLEQNVGDVLWERMVDQVANELTINVEAGGFMTMSLSWLGRTPTRLTAAPAAAALSPLSSDALYTFNDATVSIGGSAVANVRSMNLTLTNNLSSQQTDDFVPYDIVTGNREVSVGFDVIFESLDHYNAFHYGTTVGTAQDKNTFTTDLNFLFSKGVNNSIELDLDLVNYEEYPVNPDPGGEPMIVPVRARSRRNANGLLKAIVKNQILV